MANHFFEEEEQNLPFYKLNTYEQGVATWTFYVPDFIMQQVKDLPLTVRTLLQQMTRENQFKTNPKVFGDPRFQPVLYMFDFDWIDFDEATLVYQMPKEGYTEVFFTQKLAQYVTDRLRDEEVLNVHLEQVMEDISVFTYYTRQYTNPLNMSRTYNKIKEMMPGYGLDPKLMKRIDSGASTGFCRHVPAAGGEIVVWSDKSVYPEQSVVYKHYLRYKKIVPMTEKKIKRTAGKKNSKNNEKSRKKTNKKPLYKRKN